MDPRIMAERAARAQARLLAAADSIGDKLGLVESVAAVRSARHRDPQIQAIVQREAVVDLLEAVDAALLASVTVSAETDSPTEIERLARFLLAKYPDQIVDGSAVDVAIRLLTPTHRIAVEEVDQPPIFEDLPVVEPPIVAEELHVTKPGKPAKKPGK